MAYPRPIGKAWLGHVKVYSSRRFCQRNRNKKRSRGEPALPFLTSTIPHIQSSQRSHHSLFRFRRQLSKIPVRLRRVPEPPIIRGMHNETILDHFRSPRNAGTLPDATASVEAKNPVCGDILQLSVRLEDGRIAAVRFKTQGCVASIAASSVLTELLKGKAPSEARTITAEQISGALGGLPPATFHAAQLAADAIKELL